MSQFFAASFVILGSLQEPPNPEKLKKTEKWLKSDFQASPQVT